MINRDTLVRDVFVLGGSAGGIEAVTEILRRLPPSLSVTIGVALHRPAIGEGNLRRVLGHFSPLPVSEPADGDAVQPGMVCLAPRDYHLLLRDDCWHVTRGPKVHHSRPAVDPLFISAADSRQKRVVGILLSGAGSDGVVGMIAIKAAGGVAIVQDPDGNYWLLQSSDAGWNHRVPFQPTEDSDLQPVPGHYKDLLGLPF